MINLGVLFAIMKQGWEDESRNLTWSLNNTFHQLREASSDPDSQVLIGATFLSFFFFVGGEGRHKPPSGCNSMVILARDHDNPQASVSISPSRSKPTWGEGGSLPKNSVAILSHHAPRLGSHRMQVHSHDPLGQAIQVVNDPNAG